MRTRGRGRRSPPRLAAVALAMTLIGCGRSHAAHPASPPTPPPTVPAATTSTTSTTTTADPAATLASYVGAHPEAATHSGPVPIGANEVAVVGLTRGSHDHAVEVLDVGGPAARPLAALELPQPSYDFADLPVEVLDVTGDGRADFLVRVSAADNQPGVVVSDDGGAWRLVAATGGAGGAPPVTEVYVSRDPSFRTGHLTSIFNDCVPDCADGHQSTLTWVYQRSTGSFRTQ